MSTQANGNGETTTDASANTNAVAGAPGADALAQAATDARAAERARVAGIIGSEEAKGREGLANHFAMNTDMSVEAAVAALAAAPKAQAAAAQTEAGANADAAHANAFNDAMSRTDNPNIGPDGKPAAAGGEDASADKSARLLGAQSKATGRSYETAK